MAGPGGLDPLDDLDDVFVVEDVLLAHSLRVVLHTATPHERTAHAHAHTQLAP